jgi:hypothetical protein
MINRAKCKLCSSIIESLHPTDYVACKCGEIAVDGGQAMKCFAGNWENFVRVDDLGNEIVVKLKEEIEYKADSPKPSKKELLDMLSEMIKNIENLPPNAMSTPITHYDLLSALLLVSAVLRAE